MSRAATGKEELSGTHIPFPAEDAKEFRKWGKEEEDPGNGTFTECSRVTGHSGSSSYSPQLCGKLSPIFSCYSYVMSNICLLANSWVIENSICRNSRSQNNFVRSLSPPPIPTLQPGPSATEVFWGALQCTDCLEEGFLDSAREQTFGFFDSDAWI